MAAACTRRWQWRAHLVIILPIVATVPTLAVVLTAMLAVNLAAVLSLAVVLSLVPGRGRSQVRGELLLHLRAQLLVECLPFLRALRHNAFAVILVAVVVVLRRVLQGRWIFSCLRQRTGCTRPR